MPGHTPPDPHDPNNWPWKSKLLWAVCCSLFVLYIGLLILVLTKECGLAP